MGQKWCPRKLGGHHGLRRRSQEGVFTVPLLYNYLPKPEWQDLTDSVGRSRLRIQRQKITRLRLKSEFWTEGSGFGFHVAACKRCVFTHQYLSVLGNQAYRREYACGYAGGSRSTREGCAPQLPDDGRHALPI